MFFFSRIWNKGGTRDGRRRLIPGRKYFGGCEIFEGIVFFLLHYTQKKVFRRKSTFVKKVDEYFLFAFLHF